MDIKQLAETLHPLERKVLPFIEKHPSLQELMKETKLTEIEVMRALQWMQNKQIITLKEELKEVVILEKNGLKYTKEGLPERKFLIAVKEKELIMDEISKKTGLSGEEVMGCLGILRGKAAIDIKKDKQVKVAITDNGRRLLEKESFEEQFLKKTFPVELKTLKDEERFALDNLKKRKEILRTEILKLKSATLTEIGKKLAKEKIETDTIDALTPETLKQGAWKGKKFRRYDVEINVPQISGGRKQHYRRFLDQVREKFMTLGFTEMDGPLVESDFWDMDALFMPQFHSARDIHQAYYVKEPQYCKLDEKMVERVKKAHEDGYGTGSRGWQYEFDARRTHRNLLRTQGTACSARMLANPDLKIPGKYFGITRCFRYDVIDATHNCDFYQTEGIIVEENLNIKHLFGLLKMLAKEFAETDQIKLTPAYFPFTEPSVELFAKHPQLGWIELGGAGIFRPEVVKPLTGKDVSVLAWGLGIDRLAMFKLGLKDIRQLFSHDLKFLRTTKMV